MRDKTELKKTFAAGRAAIRKAVDFQLQFLQPDGGYIWEGYVNDAFHKQAYSWAMLGHNDEAHKLLSWVAKNKLKPTGELVDYGQDVYKHAWMCQGAHRIGRFDISWPVYRYLMSCKAEGGGFPLCATDPWVRAMTTAWVGITALYMGDMETASTAAECCISMQAQQPRKDRFYFHMTPDNKLVTEADSPDAGFIDTTQIKQCYWEVGFSMLLMDKMYQITGEHRYLDVAKDYMEFLFTCADDVWSYWGSGKAALACAVYYTFTGDERAAEAACQFIDFIVETQDRCGGFQYEDEPDILLIYVDHAACFTGWVLDSISYLETKIDLFE